MMNGLKQSDSAIVPMSAANKGTSVPAESKEGRAETKGNAELISLQLNDFEVAQHPLVEALRRCRGPLEPSRDGMAGMARDPGGRRNAHTLDASSTFR